MATQESAASPEAVGNGEVKMNDTGRAHVYIYFKNAAVQILTETWAQPRRKTRFLQVIPPPLVT